MQRLCKLIYKIMGWTIIGELPKDKKYLVIVAPHTSNWDFFICLCARFIVGVKVNFLAKSQLFFFPFGLFLKAVGGAPVDRSKKGNQVEKVVELFRTSDELRLGLAPEGTRSPVTRWKEGFYHIACQAHIPIVMIGPDYSTREIRIHEPFWPTGDINSDFPKIIEFFRTIKGYRPKEIPDYQPKVE
ncbi:1-acyl-sn-glycerol-3-phosphate acyltransferase [Legionella bononiensis]|uniref:1-acyl-sn-glycerol-3-phosphate acyltransferase n=1 Tax=Legionella bononiensis TaxID=2793102 RepID=A0ABS1WAF2_9GAMM|nr:1-acyl-sn-glycerol-3-phosphate acyltransferase [Legionella bononiensis]MBL7480436.1 1-acyl-sn-glycerol-3-phosphate acyltransferase [Legionella bononiensis]MBL7526330.1 1-acyl-sn-glycerol-3-phosphate acyltransferase [Legionella bononiensis]MBL7563176.1 1-acyl-sn-glycerol-3-phosphate acyltransferase [Legionella bononiensis]